MKVVSDKDQNGKVVYDSTIARDIVECALGDVAGVVLFPTGSKQAKDSIKVEQINDDMYIDVYVKLHHTASVRETASKIQYTIKNTLETMTEFKVDSVNVHVIDVEFEDN